MFPRVNGLRTMELGSPGEMRARLNGLVLAGTKTATAGLVAEYEADSESIETVGERLVLVSDALSPVGHVVVTRVELTVFGEVTWAFAQDEGEGFTSIGDWRARHHRFWTGQGWDVTDASPIACLWLELV